eukprot:scaffold43319_cov72-Phaeocystis_antarctica.AAC.1
MGGTQGVSKDNENTTTRGLRGTSSISSRTPGLCREHQMWKRFLGGGSGCMCPVPSSPGKYTLRCGANRCTISRSIVCWKAPTRSYTIGLPSSARVVTLYGANNACVGPSSASASAAGAGTSRAFNPK